MTVAADVDWSRSSLLARQKLLLSKGSRFKPAVLGVETPAGKAVVKDVAGLPFSSRWIGRWLLRRERRVLAHLAGIDQVPALLADVDRDAFACTHLDGRPLDRELFRAAPGELVDGMNALTDLLHERGVYHLDLHQRQNILVADDRRLQLVDFGASVALGRFGRLLLGRFLAWVDRQAVLKYLARFAPETLTQDQAHEVVRIRRWRKLWIFAPKHSARETAAARDRLRR